MPRIARLVVTDYPYHITQRGNYRQEVFVTDDDYRFYLRHLNEYQEKYGLSVLLYCLMPNHVHFLAIPREKDSLAKTFNAAHMRYAHYYNNKNGLVGHLWQGRFYSCVLDEEHIIAAARYIENNPVRAKLVEKAWDWKWSSAREHVFGKEKGILELSDISRYIDVKDWKYFLSQKEEKRIIDSIKSNTLTGRPSGNEAFVSRLENITGKRLKALPHGRPRKMKK